MVYTFAWNTVVYCLRLKLSFHLVQWQYTAAPVPLFVLEPSVYQISPPLSVRLKPLFPLTSIRESDHEWFIVRISGYHFIRPHL
jgi:hypothetical protein